MKVLSDGWTAVTRDGSLSAHFEHTVVVTGDGCEILTLLGGRTRARRRASRSNVAPRVSDGTRTRQVEGIVEAQLPSGLYRVEVDGARRITAHIGGGTRSGISSGCWSATGWSWS